MQKITPFIWLNNNAEEAMNFYTSVFKNSRILNVSRSGKEGAAVSGRPEGSVMVASIELEGQRFDLINGGPEFKLTEAISFVINCEDQAEVDHYWDKLTEGGQEVQCGWLKDKFGLSWQVTPTIMGKLMSDPDKAKSGRVMAAMLTMKKIDIAKLQEAYDQE